MTAIAATMNLPGPDGLLGDTGVRAGESVPVESGNATRVCSDEHGAGYCGHRAIQTLHVRYKGAGWEQYDRCHRHRADEMAAAIRRWDPRAEIRITTAGAP